MAIVKFLNLQTPENFIVMTQSSNKVVIQQVMCPKDADGMANSEDTDQTSLYSLI